MSIARGASPRPITKYMSTQSIDIPWIKIGDVSSESKYVERTAEFVTKEGAKKSRFLRKGAFILSNSMSFGRPYLLKIDGCIHDGWISLSGYEDVLTPDFLYEVLRAETTQSYWRKKANNGGAMSNLNSDIVRGTPIPLPTIEIQESITRLLSSFGAIINNLQEEIASRQKQYEYYREQLLSF